MSILQPSKSMALFVIVCSLIVSTLVILPTPTQAVTQPGYNGKILYTNEGIPSNIYSVNSDGSNKLQLTFAGNNHHPVWSPDGSKIAFHSDRDGDDEIYTMNADGSNQTQITNNDGIDVDPRWSPNSSKITFYSDRDGNGEIYTMNADGSNQTRITNNTDMDYKPYWSPDNSQIFYLSNRTGITQLYSINANGSNDSQLTSRVTSVSFRVSGHQSPVAYDGQDIFYTEGQILHRLHLGDMSDVIVGDVGFGYYGFSPDYSKVVHTATYDQITILDIYSGEETAIPTAPTVNGKVDPVWSPDGRQILYSSYNEDWVNRYYLINLDGSQTIDLVAASWTLTSGFDWQSLPNTPPTTTADSLTVPFNTPGSINVLANDTDEEALDGANLGITVEPAHGSASVVEDQIAYTPAAGFTGSDSLTYRICDSFVLDQQCALGVLEVTVHAPTAPVVKVTHVDTTVFTAGTTHYTTTNPQPTFSGTASPGATIQVEIHSDPVRLTTTASSTGDWSVTPSTALPVGEHEVVITATLKGQTTQLDSFVLGIQTVSELPHTGASPLPLRGVGGGLILVGSGLGYWQRRRVEELVGRVPALFP